MPRKQLGTLTEPIYCMPTVPLRARYGMKITEFVPELTRGRVHLVPGTLYTILSKLENEDMIRETESDGRKQFYPITEKGKEVLMQEYRRLETMLQDREVWIER